MDTQYPILRFVDSPDATADTRLDFHDRNCWTTPEEWQFTPGEFLGEPGGLGGDTGYTSVGFTWYIKAESRADALAQQARLARELQRDETYLLFQLSATDRPQWFKCYRSSVGAMSLRYVQPLANERDVWFLDVSLVADTHSLGAQKSFDLTITNNPATGGLTAVLPEIEGDAPTPLVIEMPDTGSPYLPLVGVTSFDRDDVPALQFWQAESWTPGASSSVVADAAFSGGFKVTATLDTSYEIVLTGDVTTTTAGRFRLFARVKQTSASFGAATVKGGGGALVRSVATRLTGAPTQLVELGEYVFPFGNHPTSRPYTLEAGTNAVTIKALREDSAGLQIDYIVALPVDGIDVVRSSYLDLQASVVSALWSLRRVDGEEGTFEALTATGGHIPYTAPVTPVGGFPEATPGAHNVMTVFQRKRAAGGTEPADAIADSLTLTVKYHPRFVYLAGL